MSFKLTSIHQLKSIKVRVMRPPICLDLRWGCRMRHKFVIVRALFEVDRSFTMSGTKKVENPWHSGLTNGCSLKYRENFMT